MRRFRKASFIGSILSICILFSAIPINTCAAGSDANSFVDDLKTGGFESYTDVVFEKNMSEYKIPGGVICVVKDGKEVFSKGYGYADAESQSKVSPAETRFRIGSITKTFTETAVMQLYEKGQIDLNADVNTYLIGFNLKNTYTKPVTMAELLTHTSGIDSDEIGDLTHDGSDNRTLNEVLSKRMLPVVREPGTEIEYSNYGITLAGCVVENVSGINCRDYITDNILNPLGMLDTKFTLESEGLAQGYNVLDGKLVKKSLNGTFVLYPVGGLISTADDMAKYMAVHLNHGEYNGIKILSQNTSKLMQERHMGFDDHLPGFCYGFYEKYINGQRIIGHDGYSEDGFLSEMCLLPQYSVGVFVAINQGSNNSFPQDYINEFVSRYYASDITVQPASEDKDNHEVVGTYRFGEYTKSTLSKADIFGAGEDVTVTDNGDGSITLSGTDTFTGAKSTYKATKISPFTYQLSSGDYVIFKKDAGGAVKYMAKTSDSWHGTYEKISWYEGNSFQTVLFVFLLVISIFEVIVCLIYVLRRFGNKTPEPKITSAARISTGICSLLNVLFFLIAMTTWGDRLRYGVPFDIKLLLCIPTITSVMTVFLVIAGIVSLKYNKVSRFSKAVIFISAVSGLVFIWFYNYWNFLGFRY